MAAGEEVMGQPEELSVREEDCPVIVRVSEIDFGVRAIINHSVDGEWPRVHSYGGPDDYIQSGPGHYDMI